MGERLFCWAGDGAGGVRAGDAWVVRGRDCDWRSLIAEEAVGARTEENFVKGRRSQTAEKSDSRQPLQARVVEKYGRSPRFG